ncbi:MAG TPA: hypothetical protein VFW80_09680 [Gaiellaceae bacterium]|nr:hypothetical protein [Gaiellaceae bacterium]
MVRAAAVLVVLGVLAWFYAVSEDLPRLSVWADVAFLTFGLIPVTFVLVLLALPLRRAGSRFVGQAAVALVVLSVALEAGGLDIAANFVKIAAVAAVAWWFLSWFEALSWVLLIAVLIVPVDIFSVARGPTKEIVENQPEVFNALSISFPLPGEHNSAQLGLPDVLFFSLFLAAADRFGLRVRLTWLLMALSFGATLALAVGFDISGLPALPLLSVAFVLANADRFWRDYRGWRSARAGR